jgi:hypothetical protein
MRPGFVIMQIGNVDMDRVYEGVIAPALRDSDIDPRRVDRHNEGRLLNTEIVRLIREADIIVADLTNERPNCYLEVGYSMGLGKFANLILCAREDHKPDRPGRQPTDPKVHFDLGGYDFLYWRADDLDGFREALMRRVHRRLGIIPKPTAPQAPWNDVWLHLQREEAERGLRQISNGFMEVVFGTQRQLNVPAQLLLSAAEESQVHSFGWPLWIVMPKEEWRPRPTGDGITAQVVTEDQFDFWTLNTRGWAYLLQSLFEDKKATKDQYVFFDTRIIRVTEIFLYCRNLLKRLGVSPDEKVTVMIRHAGLRGRQLTAVNPMRDVHAGKAAVDERTDSIVLQLADLDGDLVPIVKSVLDPLFTLFDFFQLSDRVYRELVEAFEGNRYTG